MTAESKEHSDILQGEGYCDIFFILSQHLKKIKKEFGVYLSSYHSSLWSLLSHLLHFNNHYNNNQGSCIQGKSCSYLQNKVDNKRRGTTQKNKTIWDTRQENIRVKDKQAYHASDHRKCRQRCWKIIARTIQTVTITLLHHIIIIIIPRSPVLFFYSSMSHVSYRSYSLLPIQQPRLIINALNLGKYYTKSTNLLLLTARLKRAIAPISWA